MIKFIQKLRSRKGFTLVELIVVVAIIAILTAVLVPVIGNYVNDAAQTAADQGAKEMQVTLSNVVTNCIAKGDTFPNGAITFTGPNCNTSNTNFDNAVNAACASLDPAVVIGATISATGAVTAVSYTNGTYVGNAA